MDCLFCGIVGGRITSEILYENEKWICIRDIAPQARVHLLFITKEHIASFSHISTGDGELMTQLIEGVHRVATEMELASYRLIINSGVSAGQTIMHLHVHLLSGDELSEDLSSCG